MTRFLVIMADFLQEMPGIEPWPQGWHTSDRTTELVEVEVRNNMVILKMLCGRKISVSLLKTCSWFSWLTLQGIFISLYVQLTSNCVFLCQYINKYNIKYGTCRNFTFYTNGFLHWPARFLQA